MPFLRVTMLVLLMTVLLLPQLGCEVMPIVRIKPTLHNPYPQLTDVAVVPFFNRTGNMDLDGRMCAAQYAQELQRVPGYRVVAQTLIENAMIENNLTRFENADDIRKLGKILGVEAIIVGSVNSFNAYYPQKMGLDVEWYAVNPYLHPIVPGSGIPWGTPEESQVPDKILLQAEHALARAQLLTQTPDAPETVTPFSVAAPPSAIPQGGKGIPVAKEKLLRTRNGIQLVSYWSDEEAGEGNDSLDVTQLAVQQQEMELGQQLMKSGVPYVPGMETTLATPKPQLPQPLTPLVPPLSEGPANSAWTNGQNGTNWLQNQIPTGTYPGNYPGYPIPPGISPEALMQYGIMPGMIPAPPMLYPMMPAMPTLTAGHIVGEPENFPGLPANWPDPRGFIPDGPQSEKPQASVVNTGPVMQHSAIYNANDRDFTQALADYHLLFRDDKRIDGWQGMIENQDEFMSFCCRMHIWEMLTARGGAGKAETVSRTWKPWFGGKRPY